MAVSVTNVLAQAFPTNATSYVTDAIDFGGVSNKVLTVAVFHGASSAANLVAPSFSGCGVSSWTAQGIAGDQAVNATKEVRTYRALATPTNGALTVSFSATQQFCVVFVDVISGSVTTGTNGADALRSGSIIQQEDKVSPFSFTMASFENVANATYVVMAFSDSSNIPALSSGAGMTEVAEAAPTGELNRKLYSQFSAGNVTSPSITWSGLTVDNIFGQGYEIRAATASGVSGTAANTFPALTSSATTVLKPAAPSSLNVTTASASQINGTFTDNSDNETGFKVERAPDVAGSPGSFTEIQTLTENDSTFSDVGLAASTKYHYRVRAYNANGNSAYSNVDFDTTSAGSAVDFINTVFPSLTQDAVGQVDVFGAITNTLPALASAVVGDVGTEPDAQLVVAYAQVF